MVLEDTHSLVEQVVAKAEIAMLVGQKNPKPEIRENRATPPAGRQIIDIAITFAEIAT